MKHLLLIGLLLIPGLAEALSLTGEVRWEGEVRQAGSVRVEAGATLTIAPGTRVTFAEGGLEVVGRLKAREVSFDGENWLGIVLKECDLSTLIVDATITGAETGIQVIGGAPRIEGTTLVQNRVGIELRQTGAIVSGCRFRENRDTGLLLKDEASAAVVDNSFVANGAYGVRIERANPRRFAGNTFNDNPTGILIAHVGSDPLLEENCLTGNQVAIRIDRAARPTLRRNDLRNNGTGLDLYRRADPLVETNRIADNRVGVQVVFSSYPQLRGNDLSGNGVALLLHDQSTLWEQQKGERTRSRAAAATEAGKKHDEVDAARRAPGVLDGTIDARDNWWGSEATLELERIGADGNASFIVDGRDSAGFEEDGVLFPLDRVRYAPWRQEAVWP